MIPEYPRHGLISPSPVVSETEKIARAGKTEEFKQSRGGKLEGGRDVEKLSREACFYGGAFPHAQHEAEMSGDFLPKQCIK